MLGTHSGKENTAIVTDVGFGKGKVSVITENNEDIKITEVDSTDVTPIFSSSLTLLGPIGENFDFSALFNAITNLKN